jgi:hypothetical protein
MRPPGSFKLLGRHRRAFSEGSGALRGASLDAPLDAFHDAQRNDSQHDHDVPDDAAPYGTPGLDPLTLVSGREMRIVESLRNQIVEGGCTQELRIRRIFEGAREIYRIEIEVPELGYQRTTLLDGDALEELLAHDDVRDVVDHHIR